MLKLIEPLRIVEYGEFLHNKVKDKNLIIIICIYIININKRR